MFIPVAVIVLGLAGFLAVRGIQRARYGEVHAEGTAVVAVGQGDRTFLGNAADRDQSDLEPQTGAVLDGVALGVDQLHESRADVAASEQADAYRRHGHGVHASGAPYDARTRFPLSRRR